MAKRWIPSKLSERKRDNIAKALSKVGFILPGSLAVRTYRCGKSNCICHTSEDRMHGPYIQWTRSVEGKTVHRRLTQEQLQDYEPYFIEAKRIRDLIARLEDITMDIVEKDSRWNQK
jgi:hypothetical protein